MLSKIVAAASSLSHGSSNHDTVSALYGQVSAIEKCQPINLDDFIGFIRDLHDIAVSGDSSLRAVLIRSVRFGLQSRDHCDALIREEFHWIITVSLEKDVEFVQERMQALKLMKKFLSISAESFPVSFARALVAVANSKEDNIRRVCLETIREVSLINPQVIVKVGGISCLLEAVIEPSMQDMAESILLSFLYLLNDISTR